MLQTLPFLLLCDQSHHGKLHCSTCYILPLLYGIVPYCTSYPLSPLGNIYSVLPFSLMILLSHWSLLCDIWERNQLQENSMAKFLSVEPRGSFCWKNLTTVEDPLVKGEFSSLLFLCAPAAESGQAALLAHLSMFFLKGVLNTASIGCIQSSHRKAWREPRKRSHLSVLWKLRDGNTLYRIPHSILYTSSKYAQQWTPIGLWEQKTYKVVWMLLFISWRQLDPVLTCVTQLTATGENVAIVA